MNFSEDEVRQTARKRYDDDSDNDIEVDDTAQVNEVEDGYWVAAWVYVRKEEPNDLQ